jgi:hypothetical protein
VTVDPERSIVVMPGLGPDDGARCTAASCPLDATCRVVTGDDGVNVVCSFHAITYVGVWLDGLLRGVALDG